MLTKVRRRRLVKRPKLEEERANKASHEDDEMEGADKPAAGERA